MKLVVAGALALIALTACGASTAPDPRYPARPEGCGLKSFEGSPPFPVDELGAVEVDCAGTNRCGRKLADEVCKRGGDVVWGLGGNTSPSNVKRGRAAHTSHTNWGPRAEGCAIAVSAEAPSTPSENIGPVSASCSADDSDDACMRVLRDETCKIGGDLLWGVGAPTVRGTRKHFTGRAAHTLKK